MGYGFSDHLLFAREGALPSDQYEPENLTMLIAFMLKPGLV
jgi:hypothetical protein